MSILQKFLRRQGSGESSIDTFDDFVTALKAFVTTNMGVEQIHVEIEPYIIRSGAIEECSYMLDFKAMTDTKKDIVLFTKPFAQGENSDENSDNSDKKELRNQLLSHARAQLDILSNMFPEIIVDVIGKDGRVVHDTGRPQLHHVAIRSA